MDGRIDESMRASIEVELFDKKKKIVLVKDIGKSAGIEVAGNYEMLIKWIIFLTLLKNSVIKKALKIGLYLFF